MVQCLRSMPKKSNISTIILTFNEEKNIEACLESVKWADEVIVIDSESTDNTIEIVKKFTDKIYVYKFKDDFAEQRNFALNKTTNDWVLFLDADETLPSGTEKNIQKIISEFNVDGFWFPRRNYINDSVYLKHGLFYPDWQLRLLKNQKGLKFKGKIHEQADIPIEKTKRIKEIEIYHNPSRTKYDSFLSFHRMFPFIKGEGNELAESNVKTRVLLKKTFTVFLLEIWWNLIKREGYKDGLAGIKGTIIWALYKELAVLYSLKSRIIRE